MMAGSSNPLRDMTGPALDWSRLLLKEHWAEGGTRLGYLNGATRCSWKETGDSGCARQGVGEEGNRQVGGAEPEEVVVEGERWQRPVPGTRVEQSRIGSRMRTCIFSSCLEHERDGNEPGLALQRGTLSFGTQEWMLVLASADEGRNEGRKD